MNVASRDVQYVASDGTVRVRLMRDDPSDYRLLAGWLTDPRVLEFYEGRDNSHDLTRVREKYSPRVQAEEDIVPCIIELDQRPIGYIQYYPLPPESLAEYRVEATEAPYGIDLFIGVPELWGEGYGTRALRAVTSYLFDRLGAGLATVDPYVTNQRAMRSYEKAGFEKVRILPRHWLHEGVMQDSWLMVLRRHGPDKDRSRG